MKIGIFGGTFDPFHLGDLAIVSAALKKVDKIIIVPTVTNYYRQDKRTLFTFDERVRIIQDFICGVNNVVIDILEKNKDSKWRTINTIESLRMKYPYDELYFIMGEDSYDTFDTWFRYDDILALCKLIVINRSNDFKPTKYDAISLTIKGFEDVSSSKIREKLIEELTDLYLNDKEYYCE